MSLKRIERIPSPYRETVKKQLDLISTLIRKKRESKKLTQEALAEDLEIDPQNSSLHRAKKTLP